MVFPSEWPWHEPQECREQMKTCGGREAFLQVELATIRGEQEGQSRQGVHSKTRIIMRSFLRCGPALPYNRRQQFPAPGEFRRNHPPSNL